MSNKLGDYSGPHTTKTQTIKKLKDTKKACNKLEKESGKIRIEFVNKIKKKKKKKTEGCRVSVEMLEKQLLREKKTREVRQISKVIR